MDSVVGNRVIQFFIRKLSGSVFRNRHLPGVAAMLAAFWMSCAHGGHITMATQYSVTPVPDGAMLAVTVRNRGDVPAHAVQFEVSVEGNSLVGPVIDKLAVDESTSVEFTLADHFQRPGRYPLVIRTFYKDTAGHRFTALIVGFYNHQSSVKPDVFIEGQATIVPVDGSGTVAFVLRNEGSSTLAMDLELHLPEELSTARRHAVVEVVPHSEDTVMFDLENYSALANSRYPVALVGRYEHDGHSYGVAGTATIRLGREDPGKIRPIWIWFMLGGLLPVVIVFLRMYERRVRRQAS